MKEFLRGALGFGVFVLLIYLRFRLHYRYDLLNIAPRVKIQTVFSSHEESNDDRK